MSATLATDVVLVEPSPLYRSALVDACRRDPRLNVLTTHGTCAEGIAAICATMPEVAVVEPDLPDARGQQLLAACRSEGIPTHVLFLTTRRDGADVYAAIAAGAAGYLLKTSDRRTICDGVVAVASGETVIDPGVHRAVAAEIRLHAAAAEICLTAREGAVLGLVAEGLSSRAIGERLFISETTVKSHLANLYEKLGVSTRAGAVAQAMRRGLVSTSGVPAGT